MRLISVLVGSVALLSALLHPGHAATSVSPPAQSPLHRNMHLVSFAIVLGNNLPGARSELPKLRYADDDAFTVGRLLRQAGVHVELLTRLDRNSAQQHAIGQVNGPPTLAAYRTAVKRTLQRMREVMRGGAKTELLLFFSGHGDVEHGEGYLVLENGRLTRSELYNSLLAQSPARFNHVIVDACKSYFLVMRKGRGAQRRPYRGPAFASAVTAGSLSNTGFVLSTSSARDSHEWERYQAGIFTHQIRSALRGAADVNLDGLITYGELGAFLSTSNRAITNPRFRPDFTVLPPGSTQMGLSQPLLGWPRRSVGLVIDRRGLGHMYVESATGERLVDAHPAYDQQLRLHVPSERPLFVRTEDGRREYALDAWDPALLSQIEPRVATLTRKGALHLALRKLFAVPFGHSDVTRYADTFQPTDTARPSATSANLSRTDSVHSTQQAVRSAAGWTSVGALAVAGSLHLWSFLKQHAGLDAPQEERPAINDQIQRLNIAAGVFYGLAGAAGATWIALQIFKWTQGTNSDRVAVLPTIGMGGAGLEMHIALP